MAYRARKSLAAVASVVVLGWVLQGCTGSAHEQGAVGTSGDGAIITVSTAGGIVHVGNASSEPLVDMEVAINPAGGSTAYTKSVSRLDAGETRDIRLDEFRAKNGAGLNRMFVVPKNVVVAASDARGKRHQVTVRWQ